jgi:hypothetical protein
MASAGAFSMMVRILHLYRYYQTKHPNKGTSIRHTRTRMQTHTVQPQALPGRSHHEMDFSLWRAQS